MKVTPVAWKLTALVLVLLTLVIGLPANADDGPTFPIPAIEIPQQKDARPVPIYIGHPAVPKPVSAPAVPDNPFESPGAWGAIHNDTYQSDTYFTPGPLGRKPVVTSSWLPLDENTPLGLVTGITFDSDGRLVIGIVYTDWTTGLGWVQLRLIDPGSLATLALLDLPTEPVTGADFRPSGTYFYQDQLDRTVIGTSERSIWIISHTATAFTVETKIDLAEYIDSGDSIQALQPDFTGRVWFTSKGGVVGTVDMEAKAVIGAMTLPPGERIANGHSIDGAGGVYIVSTAAMYRFDPDGGAPAVTWREPYDAGTYLKPGQVDIGSGTTPTLMGLKYVAITDNADPRMHVLVYRRDKVVAGPRLVCAEPVFQPYRSATENSLVATDKSIVVENNFGYTRPNEMVRGRTVTPGITRIDIDADGNGCHQVWTNREENTPTVVTKMSLANGLIYTYTKPEGHANSDPWYFTALDFETGKTVFKRLAGTGLLYNNHYAPVYLGPDGSWYVGVLGGFVMLRDTE